MVTFFAGFSVTADHTHLHTYHVESGTHIAQQIYIIMQLHIHTYIHTYVHIRIAHMYVHASDPHVTCM